MIKIDLDNTYDATSVSEDFKEITFNSFLKTGKSIELHVCITEHPDPMLPMVYNLAFGPMGNNNEIDDQIVLSHQNVNKVFSTILLFSILFLQKNAENKFSIGIDGSNETRTYLYHRMLKYNHEQIASIISTVGVDWYVKLLRNNDIERDDDGTPFFKPRPEPFDLKRLPNDLYRYYIFSLNK